MGGKMTPEQRAEKNASERANYAYCRSRGLCVECGGQRKAEPDSIYCGPCHEKIMAGLHRRKAEKRTPYYRRKLAGLCVMCGKEPAENGTVRCAACNERQKEINRQNYIKRTAKKRGK